MFNRKGEMMGAYMNALRESATREELLAEVERHRVEKAAALSSAAAAARRLEDFWRNTSKNVENREARARCLARAYVAAEIADEIEGRNVPSIKELVDRFLAWSLPQSVCSDACVTDSKYPFPRSGTSLLTADEAKQMIEYLLGRVS